MSIKTTRRQLLGGIALLPVSASALSAAAATSARPAVPDAGLQRIIWGSCAHQDKDQPIWDAINAAQPGLFVFLGDNIYGDSTDPEFIAGCYRKLAAKPGFVTLRERTPIIATWDDHDYGQNDAGRDYPSKLATRALMLDFFDTPDDSSRRTQEGGIFTSYVYGPAGRRVQVLLMDLRWNRSPILKAPQSEQEARKHALMGPYAPDDSAGAVMVGEPQWQWLEAQLKAPADVRILGSSIQALADFTGWESWSNYPRDRQRLLALLKQYDIRNLVIISGDTHWAEISEMPRDGQPPLLEVTSSGLTEEWPWVSPNRYRMGEAYAEANFGVIDIDWSGTAPGVTLSVRDVDGKTRMSRGVMLG